MENFPEMSMNRAAAALVILVTMAAAPTALAQDKQPARAADTDQTINVTRGARLNINNFAGEVVIRTWDQDRLRVLARHSSRSKVNIRNTPAAVSVSAESSTGVASIDYEITAPAWMPMKVDGTYNFVSIEGAQSEVSATTVRGDIVVKGGTGFVTAKSIEGEVLVEGARGRINVESVNERVHISGSSGDIVVETTNGDISMTGMDAKSVEAGTVNGDLTFEGNLAAGRFRFTTHNGDIQLNVPETANATFNVRAYNGDFSTNLPLKGGMPAEVRRGRRVTFTLGSGSADVELESFNGTIQILRPGTSRGTRGKDLTPLELPPGR
jgi:DUF4097 and DUF4098 domain-containing protein YvlB